jgi:hypothetical protein
MPVKANNLEDSLNQLIDHRMVAINKLRKVINEKLPEGFEKCINYNLIGYVVPHSKYPKDDHCNLELPLPFINISSQKNAVNLYQMGVYAEKKGYIGLLVNIQKTINEN